MIELKVAAYCHNCPYFKSKEETSILRDVMTNNITKTNTTVTCEESKRCENIAKWLLDYIKTNGGKL